MVSYTELQTRLARFVDAEMLPHMTGGKRILLGGYDALFSAVSPYINEPVTLSLPVVGDFRLDRSDFEKLYRYLKGEL